MSVPKKVKVNESAIENLDSTIGPGTPWVAYIKRGKIVIYFDRYGNLRPPLELQIYFKDGVLVTFNRIRIQSLDSNNCGHLCIQFLKENSK